MGKPEIVWQTLTLNELFRPESRTDWGFLCFIVLYVLPLFSSEKASVRCWPQARRAHQRRLCSYTLSRVTSSIKEHCKFTVTGRFNQKSKELDNVVNVGYLYKHINYYNREYHHNMIALYISSGIWLLQCRDWSLNWITNDDLLLTFYVPTYYKILA